MLRILALLLGSYLACFGIVLADDERGLVESRLVARDGLPGRLRSSDFAVDDAYRALASASPRGDSLELEAALALELDRRQFPKAFVDSGVREDRVAHAFDRMARAVPVSADAWCMRALHNARMHAPDWRAVEANLRACYELGPREIRLFESRVLLSFAAWDELPKDLRRRALTDAAVGLADAHFRGWMLERLAYGAAIIAPAKEPVFRVLIEPHGDELVKRFQSRIIAFRKQFSPNSGGLFPG